MKLILIKKMDFYKVEFTAEDYTMGSKRFLLKLAKKYNKNVKNKHSIKELYLILNIPEIIFNET
jgi:hypothetical protein